MWSRSFGRKAEALEVQQKRRSEELLGELNGLHASERALKAELEETDSRWEGTGHIKLFGFFTELMSGPH